MKEYEASNHFRNAPNTQQEKNPAGAKRRSKFSDLVFTRQFTAFDRNNTESADSPFHGFFTLFWLGIALFMIKMGAENWRQHGNILGTNEIMGLMFRRDVMVLGLSDGVMCAATGFGLLLQKAIRHGWISWNKTGWIIQSVSPKPLKLYGEPLTLSLDLGILLHRRCSWVDLVPRMALDAHRFLRTSRSRYVDEATQLRIL